MSEQIISDQYSYVIIVLKNGESIVGPAIIHRPVGESVNIEKWIYTEFVVVNYPIRMFVDITTEKTVLGFGKYVNFSDNHNVMIKTESIQSINYISDKTKNFYLESKNYLEKFIDPQIENELQTYTNILKKKNSESNEIDKEMMEKFEILKAIFGSNNGPTIH